MRLRKTYEVASFKALPDEDGQKGRFEAVVSVFGNVDLQGDRVMPGAFEKSLDQWRASADPIPIIWSHDWADPFAHIGYADPKNCMEVTPGAKASGHPGGLVVRGQMDIDKPFAAQVYDLLKERRVKEWSFAYDTLDERPGDDGANELVEVALIEAGPTLKGANPDTITLGVKSALESASLLERKTPASIIAHAMQLDPAIAAALAGTSLEPTKAAPACYRIVEQVPEYENAYDLYKSMVFAVKNTAGETIETFDTRDEAVAKAAELEKALEDETPTDDAKTGAKPWHVEENDGKYCCIVNDTGETLDCHDTEDEAMAHVRALYANEASAGSDGKSDPADHRHGTGTMFDTTFNVVTDAEDGESVSVTFTDAEGLKSYIEGQPNQTITVSTGTTANLTPDGAKAGRVVGAKAASALKAALTKAVDDFVSEVNGAARDAEAADEEKAAPEDVVEMNKRLEALLNGTA